MRQLVLTLLAMFSLVTFAQREGDKIEIEKTDGTVLSYNLTGTNNALGRMDMKESKVGVVLKGLETFGYWDEINVNNIREVRFQVYDPTFKEETMAEAVKKMGLGYNFGNTLEAFDTGLANNLANIQTYETRWGQPQITKAQLQFLKDGGFSSVRIPITWVQHIDSQGHVDEAFMERVEQVVNWTQELGLYCIINLHHDAGSGDVAYEWIHCDEANHTANQARFKTLWTEIANRFIDCNEKLIFEGWNEMLDAQNNWGVPSTAAAFRGLNLYAQDFVDAVRSTGGNNLKRNLMIEPYAASNSEQALQNLTLPTDPSMGHMAFTVHSYDPYNWINRHGSWNKTCQDEITAMFDRLERYSKQWGMPCILGEYGTHGEGQVSVTKTSTDDLKQAAADQAAQIVALGKEKDIPTFYWMNIFDASDRNVPQWSLPAVVAAMKAAVR